MTSSSENQSFYNKLFSLIEENDYLFAVENLIKYINSLDDYSEIEFAFLNCGFLNYKLRKYKEASEDFSKSIQFQNKHQSLTLWSRDISYSARSHTRYKLDDFRGGIEDMRMAREIRRQESLKYDKTNFRIFDYRSILLNSSTEFSLNLKYKLLVKMSQINKSKYDLVADYKKIINQDKRDKIINELEGISDLKYKKGDYKGSIRALRRSEKYY